MRYITEYGDTLVGIAARYTLSPDYGIGIARHNGFVGSENPTGYPVNETLEPGLEIDIPDNWIKTNSGTSGIPRDILVGVAVGFILFLLTKGKR